MDLDGQFDKDIGVLKAGLLKTRREGKGYVSIGGSSRINWCEEVREDTLVSGEFVLFVRSHELWSESECT